MGYAQKVGVNTTAPKVALEITNNSDAAVPNGLIIPSITGRELKDKDPLYTVAHDGIMVFVKDPLSRPDFGSKTEAVTEQGYYYYDALMKKWKKLDRYTNVVAEKTIAQVNRSTQQQQVYSSGTAVSWNDISTTAYSTNDISLSGPDKSIINIGPGKSFKLTAVVGVGVSSAATYLKTEFKLAEPLRGNAKLYLSTPGTVESSSLTTAKGSGTYPVCFLYSGEYGVKLILEAKGPVNGVRTFVGGKPGQQEGTFLSIQEL